jgi:hypothetical protein
MTPATYKNLPQKQSLPLFAWAERETVRTLPPFARHIVNLTGINPSTARLYAELVAPVRED